MNYKTAFFILLFIILSLFGFFAYQVFNPAEKPHTIYIPNTTIPVSTLNPTNDLGISNPASENCKVKGGELEIITNKDGSQFAMCKFKDYSCEEWVFFNNQCDIEADSKLITNALLLKGYNLTKTKIVIHKHMGKYIYASSVPVDGLGGGGYVFAVKENEKVTVLADGNGVIYCRAFKEYPDYPTYLLAECVGDDERGVTR